MRVDAGERQWWVKVDSDDQRGDLQGSDAGKKWVQRLESNRPSWVVPNGR